MSHTSGILEILDKAVQRENTMWVWVGDLYFIPGLKIKTQDPHWIATDGVDLRCLE